MQILEASPLGLRTARHEFESPMSSTMVTLFPMVHIGERSFFDQVFSDACSHDVVLVEGIRSPVVQRLTTSYRWIESSRLGLVVQPEISPDLAANVEIVHSDLSTEEFHKEWQRVPLWFKLLIYGAAPLSGLHLRFASRETIASRIRLNDRRSRDEILSWDPCFATLHRAILEARDARLIEHLNTQLSRQNPSVRRLAIVYGAQHMRAVLAELAQQQFVAVSSEWQTVFRL